MIDYLALNASAGSGKTFALSARFIALILNGADISEITALTFTKKAANEMKERIIKTFLNLHREDKKGERKALVDILGVSDEEVVRLRDKFKRSFLEANLKISTFDSFFGGILRQFSLNLGLSPDFSVSNGLVGKQRAQFVAEIEKNTQLLRALSLLIVQAENNQESFFNNLEMLYENFGDLAFSEDIEFPSDDGIFIILDKMKEYALNRQASGTVIKSFEKTSVNELIERGFLQRDSLDYKTYAKIYSKDLDDLFLELKSRLKLYFDELEVYKLNELGKFLRIYKNAKLEVNKKLNALSFSDVSRNVYELLCADKTPINALYFRLDGRINHLLIDEFQDTNVRQYDIIKPLIAESVAGEGQNGKGSFFYVGDAKQSIYRFRGGKKELFEKLKSDFPQIVSENLPYNYRSRKALVKFTNAVFKDKIENFIPQISKKTDDKITEPVSGECEYFDVQSDDHGFLRVCKSDDVAAKAVDEVKNLLLNGVSASDITILCWKNDDINVLVELLEKEGISGVSEGSLALLKSPFVAATVEYAKFCLLGDDIYRLNAQAILDVPDLERIEIEPNLSASATLLKIAEKLKVSHADMAILIEESLKFNNLGEFIFNLDSFDASAGAKSKIGVNIMTVFKSKGLEFEHVIVCDKIGRGRNDGSNFLVEYDVKEGWQIRHNAKKESFDRSFRELKLNANRLDKEEDMNKIYVAFTRAISSLIVVKNAEPSGLRPSFFTAYELSSGEIVEYLDLKEFSFGKIVPSAVCETRMKNDDTKIELPTVSKQEIKEISRERGENLNAIYFGLALHFLLEMARDFSEYALKEARNAVRNKFFKYLSLNELDEVYLRALNLARNEKFISIVSGKRILKEQPLAFNGALKQMDLLCVDDDEICVIDYKTSVGEIESNVAQVSWYKEAVGKIYEGKSVKAMIFYALKDEIRVIEV